MKSPSALRRTPRPILELTLAALAALSLDGALSVRSAQAAETPPSTDIVVTATRVDEPSYDIPASISSVAASELTQDALGVNLSDDIGFVHGLLARNGDDYAQDQQISIRGIGANSTFGVRGVRIYQDGIPATGPDGQGQVSQFNLESAQRIEVLRGPFSALYGNSAGGVIQMFTAPGTAPAEVRADVAYGSFGTFRAGVDASDASGAFDYNVAFSHFSFQGYRPQQSARDESFNTKLDYTFGPREKLTFIGNVVSRPDAEDPQGLTPAQFAISPDQTSSAALQFKTRKSLEQQTGGLIYEHGLTDSQSIQLMGYYGHRSVLQFLSIPVAVQAPPTSSGAVIDLDRAFGGGDVRWTWRRDLAGGPFSWVVGTSYDTQDELRRGYDNFSGDQLGVVGAERRNEDDIAWNFDEYTQASWQFLPLWTLTAGLRHSEVRFDSEDHFITPTNGNDSGSVTYTASSPVAGLLYAVRPWLHLYASYGQGFQTPLASELAYQPNGAPGLNFAVRPARSDNSEVGAKLDVSSDLTADVAGFETLTRNEIVVATNLGGRSTYQNAGRTNRSGAEASLDYRFAPDWRVQLAYTYVSATYTDAYLTCAATPCATPDMPVASGNRLPGVPLNDAYARLGWGRTLGWRADFTAQFVSAIAVNDANTAFAPAYPVFNASAGYAAKLRGGMRFSAFLRLNNVLDRHYVGSVVVDDGNGRYFYPAAGFNVLGGLTLTFD
ncbi:MAG: TonB-dependent receptor family protein [Steroidobacteraceae bacterium]